MGHITVRFKKKNGPISKGHAYGVTWFAFVLVVSFSHNFKIHNVVTTTRRRFVDNIDVDRGPLKSYFPTKNTNAFFFGVEVCKRNSTKQKAQNKPFTLIEL